MNVQLRSSNLFPDKYSVKRTIIEASSEEELKEKLKNIDWSKVTDSHSGDRFNFSV